MQVYYKGDYGIIFAYDLKILQGSRMQTLQRYSSKLETFMAKMEDAIYILSKKVL
jgi:hypothetical protein